MEHYYCCLYSYLNCPWNCWMTKKEADIAKKVPTFGEILDRDTKQWYMVEDTKHDELFTSLWRWDYTVMQMTAGIRLQYFPLAIFVLGYLFTYLEGRFFVIGNIDSWMNRWEDAVQVSDVASLFVTFFLSIAVDYSVSRFFNMYWDMNKSKVALHKATALAKSYLRDDDMCYDLVRYMNLMTISHMANLSKQYNRDNFFNPLTEHFRLMTEIERKVLEPLISSYDHDEEKWQPKGGKALHEVYMWSLALLRRANERGYLTTLEQSCLETEVKNIRQSNSKLTVWVQQPLPFPFINLTILIICMFLAILAFAFVLLAREANFVTLPVFSLILISALNIGLMRLNLILNEPFKCADHGFRILMYCFDCAHLSHMLVHRNPEYDGDDENGPEFFDGEEDSLTDSLEGESDHSLDPNDVTNRESTMVDEADGFETTRESAFEVRSNPMTAGVASNDGNVEMQNLIPQFGMGVGRDGSVVNPMSQRPGGGSKGGKGKGKGKGGKGKGGKGKGGKGTGKGKGNVKGSEESGEGGGGG
jgi:hypothetical protein